MRTRKKRTEKRKKEKGKERKLTREEKGRPWTPICRVMTTIHSSFLVFDR